HEGEQKEDGVSKNKATNERNNGIEVSINVFLKEYKQMEALDSNVSSFSSSVVMEGLHLALKDAVDTGLLRGTK
nr:hypothetical protein [Tanacetum cinerariifolium]